MAGRGSHGSRPLQLLFTLIFFAAQCNSFVPIAPAVALCRRHQTPPTLSAAALPELIASFDVMDALRHVQSAYLPSSTRDLLVMVSSEAVAGYMGGASVQYLKARTTRSISQEEGTVTAKKARERARREAQQRSRRGSSSGKTNAIFFSSRSAARFLCLALGFPRPVARVAAVIIATVPYELGRVVLRKKESNPEAGSLRDLTSSFRNQLGLVKRQEQRSIPALWKSLWEQVEVGYILGDVTKWLVYDAGIAVYSPDAAPLVWVLGTGAASGLSSFGVVELYPHKKAEDRIKMEEEEIKRMRREGSLRPEELDEVSGFDEGLWEEMVRYVLEGVVLFTTYEYAQRTLAALESLAGVD
ncbi:unnamed protein product [Chrysoparadoxa australica]